MATQTIQSWAVTGETLTMKLYTQDSDTLVDSAAATEATNRDSLYAAAFTDLPADTYIVQLETAGGVVRSYYWVDTLAATGTYQAFETPSTGSVTVTGTVDANIVSSSISFSSVFNGARDSLLQMKRGDRWVFQIADLGDLTGYQKIWVTMKNSADIESGAADTTALVQIDSTTGLLYINQEVADTPANGSITIIDLATGVVEVELAGVESAKVVTVTDAYWDIQVQDSNGYLYTPKEGRFILSKDATRSVS